MKTSQVGRKRLGAISLLVLGVALLAFAATPAARADAIYNLTVDGCSGHCGPQTSFGTIDLHAINSDTVQITVKLLNNNKLVTTGSHIGFAFNVKGGGVTLGTLPSAGNLVWTDAGSPVTQAFFGQFTNGVECGAESKKSKPGNCVGKTLWAGTPQFDLQFDVSRTTGLKLSDFVANKGGYFFSADILSDTTGETGPIGAKGNVTSTPTPEPGTLISMGTGLLSVAFGLRKRLLQSLTLDIAGTVVTARRRAARVLGGSI